MLTVFTKLDDEIKATKIMFTQRISTLMLKSLHNLVSSLVTLTYCFDAIYKLL